MKKVAVVALGGNALLRGNQIGTIKEQEENTYDTCLHLAELIRTGYTLVITHGNGPQVGNILLRNEAGFDTYKIPKMPLHVCVADSQGGIGYMIERQLINILNEKNIIKNVVTIITQVLVDKNAPEFKDPNKPVGQFFLKEEADLLARANNWVFKEDPQKRGWRRVVPSPKPIDVINKNVIKDLVRKDNIVIAGGGGGIPVINDNGKLLGVDAVIDKDLAASLLANEIEADEFFILTDVPKVYINFRKPGEKAIDIMTLGEAERYLSEGHFAAGSMGPKVKAAINFVKNCGKEAVITDANELLIPNAGTKIIK